MWNHIAYIYFFIVFKYINGCDCDIKNPPNGNKIDVSNNTDALIDKKQLEFENTNITTELSDSSESTTTYDTTIIYSENCTEDHENMTDVSEAGSEHIRYILEPNDTTNVDESTETTGEYQETATTDIKETTREPPAYRAHRKLKYSNRDLVKKCRNFKKGTAFDLEKMADVWQVVYYRLPNKLKCFKLHIKLVKNRDQHRYARIYGSFNNTVRWEKCNLEIKSNDKNDNSGRRHFLQGDDAEKGVMENIIIDEEHCQNTTYLTLHKESADQWLVIKNLLVMRDCDTGDIVVFTRVPLEPKRDDILDALMVFGENKANGTMACEDKPEKHWMKYEESFISPQIK